ncbi:ergot alkaloid biosynthesis protein [Streptomyces sp. NPDC087425]|uniref:ergot alkaloid biosynthesis protein n=1 Tax=Streptomyces sp. NPDC087425 TaxID=3365787 RepID=UPI003804B1C6
MAGVLVTGGTGNTGGELVRLLRGRGVPVRVGSRTPAADDPDAVRFDWADPATHPAALAGQDRVFVVPPGRSLDPMPTVGPFLARARRLGVRKVVLLGSAIPLAPTALELADQVRALPGGVVLRPSGFMQNFLSPHPLGEGIRRDGEVRTAAGDGRLGWIDARDIAAAAATLLADLDAVPGDRRDYLLTGPQSLSHQEAAEIITAGTGRQVRVAHVSVDQQAADRRAAGIPAGFAAILAAADASVRTGRQNELSTAVLDLTGHPPHTFTQFVRDHAPHWTTPGA